jgi:hypothetical protein
MKLDHKTYQEEKVFDCRICAGQFLEKQDEPKPNEIVVARLREKYELR